MYTIKCDITTIKPLDAKAGKKIEEILSSVKDKLIKLGRDISYKSSISSSIVIEASSTAFTATDFLVQFDKQLRESLGKEFKTALKSFTIIDYRITGDLDELPKKPFTIPFAKSVDFKGKQVTLVYENIPFEFIKDNYIERSLKLIKDRIRMLNYVGKDEFREYVWEGKERKTTYKGDPAVDLEAMDWIRRTDSKGQFIFGREYTALQNAIRSLFKEKIYDQHRFAEMIFPKFEPWSVPKRSGHAKNIYPNAYFVSVPKFSSPEEWQDVMDLFEITGEVDTEKVKEKSTCVGIMSYAQCPPFWPFLKNRVIDESSLPLLTFDWSGPTYRNEAGGTHGLDRVEEFHRIETLYVGSKPQVIKTWQTLKQAFIDFYDKVLDMEIKVAKVTPWWMAHAGLKTETGNEEMGTFDFDAYLPYRGDRDKEWLEIQNVSSNGEKYAVAFNVKLKSQEYVWSGCAGASFERVIVAFLAQKGLDPKSWPLEVRKRYEAEIKDIIPLKFF